MRLRDRLGAYFGWSLSVVVFIANLSHFVAFCASLGLIWGGLRPPKSLIFIERVVIFEVFRIFDLDVVWGLFRWPLGPSWGSPGTLLAAFWGLLGPLGAVLGSSWGLLWEFLGASWATKRPRCSQDGPKSPQKAPKGSPKASKRPPERLQEAFSRLQMASKNACKGPSKD